MALNESGTPLFRFNLLRSFLPTLVTIHNTDTASGPEIYLAANKTINNPIGTTDIDNQSGDILSNGGTQTIRTNILTINSELGSIGSSTYSVNVELVQSPNRATSLTATADLDVYLKIKGLLREEVASFTGNLDLIDAGRNVNVQLLDAIKQAGGGLATGLLVDVQSPGDTSGDGTYYLYFRPDRTPTASELVYSLGVTGTGSTGVDSSYLLDLAEASGTGTIKFWEASADLSGTPRVHLTGTTDILGTGYIDVDVDGMVTLTEKAGDLQAGSIRSWAEDVLLSTVSGSIVDALADTTSDVIGINLTLTSSNGIGSPTNYLEIDSSNPSIGLVKATAPESIYMIETAGNLNLDTITSSGGNASLVTNSGSILDGKSGANAYNIQAIQIDLDANNGGIGTSTYELEIDTNPTTGRLYAEASGNIYIVEVSSALNVLAAESTAGSVQLTVRESAASGENLNLLPNGSKQIAEGSPVTVSKGRIAAFTTILLRAGDNITTDANSEILARQTINIYGDYGNADSGGTTITLRGDIASNYPSGGTTYWTSIWGDSQADTIQFGDTSGSYIKLGSKTRAYGSNDLSSAEADGNDSFYVYYLQTMAVASGHTLTLDGQAGSDAYYVYTTGSQVPRNYVINVLDTGEEADGTDNLTIFGTNGSNDIFLLRAVTAIANETAVGQPAFVGLLHGDLALYRDTIQNNETTTDVQRIYYDTAINGQVTVNGLAGNDYFASDDTSAAFTLNGGSGDDQFQIGQLFGLKRDVISGNLTANDVFPELIATTRGWLSPGINAPMIVNGNDGNDLFTVYSNKAGLQLNGNNGNDFFELRAFALAVTVDTDANNDGILDGSDIDNPTIDMNGDGVINAEDASTTATWLDDTIVFDLVDGVLVARPVINIDEVAYNMNAPVSIDGGNGFDKLALIATEFPDDIVITATGIYGMGIQATYINLEVVEVDGMEGDDEFFVLSTVAGATTRVIGNLGSDAFNVAGDVVEDIATTVNFPVQAHLLTGLDGPLAIEGGVLAGADRSLKTAVKLSGEKDAALFAIRTQPPENQQIDTLNIFNDSSTANATGTLTATNLNGFGMSSDLVNSSPAFGEPASYPGGISFGTISVDGSGNYNTNATLSTLEVLNILFGSGTDGLTISGTLNPGPDPGSSLIADHGGLTIVHGGGGSDNITVNGGAGPSSPLVVYGDTSQDGIWYGGDASAISSYDFGTKPFDQIGTEDDTYIFPLAVPFTNHGDDTINASALAGATNGISWTVGITIYGGKGNDTIYGSQTGDHLAGGSGDDTIYGQGGPDLIYGDSGINVDILTRTLEMPTINSSSSPAPYDLLSAGTDTIDGNAGNDVIFGDHGIVEQDTAEPNLPDTRLQKIQTTGVIIYITTDQPDNGAADTIYGQDGSDFIFGGPAADHVYGGEGNNILFGDLGYIDYGVADTQIDDLSSAETSIGDADTITAGGGNDIIIGGQSGDNITAGDGANILFGDNGRILSSLAVNGSLN